jgi:ABC-type arginine/histidine transport system permease subunit
MLQESGEGHETYFLLCAIVTCALPSAIYEALRGTVSGRHRAQFETPPALFLSSVTTYKGAILSAQRETV